MEILLTSECIGPEFQYRCNLKPTVIGVDFSEFLLYARWPCAFMVQFVLMKVAVVVEMLAHLAFYTMTY